MISSSVNDNAMNTRLYRMVVKFSDDIGKKKNENTNFSITPRVDNDMFILHSRLRPLFPSVNHTKIAKLVSRAKASDADYCPPNFFNYYTADFTTKTEALQFREELNKHQAINSSYIEINPVWPPSAKNSNPLIRHQNYLEPAPVGIDAVYAWQFKGGDGDGSVRLIDIEQGWIADHEDVPINTLPGTGLNHSLGQDHGTAVMGIISMQDNNVGGKGITSKAKGYVVSQWRPDGYFNVADALMTSILQLSAGDILLIQAQALDFNSGQIGPVEILDAQFHLIRLATALGIIVIEPAGNGNNQRGNDLDLLKNPEGDFILNLWDIHFRDSGAIMVAASQRSLPYQKTNYSNYGSRVDCFACGEDLMTAGLYPSSSGDAKNRYTGKFGGTSGASAIIAGAALAVQSISEANLGYRLSPQQMRRVLSHELYSTSSANGHATDKTGRMPDLKKIITDYLGISHQSKYFLHQKNRTAFEVS